MECGYPTEALPASVYLVGSRGKTTVGGLLQFELSGRAGGV